MTSKSGGDVAPRLSWPRATYRPSADPDTVVAQAYASGISNMKGIGEHLGLRYSCVSRIISRAGNGKGLIP